MRRTLDRLQQSPGVVDASAARALHARTTGWAVQRTARGADIAARYRGVERADAGSELLLARGSVIGSAEPASVPAAVDAPPAGMRVAATSVRAPSVQRRASEEGVVKRPGSVSRSPAPRERGVAHENAPARPTQTAAPARASFPAALQARRDPAEPFAAPEIGATVRGDLVAESAPAPSPESTGVPSAPSAPLAAGTSPAGVSIMRRVGGDSLVLRQATDRSEESPMASSGAHREDAAHGEARATPSPLQTHALRAPGIVARAFTPAGEGGAAAPAHRAVPAIVWRAPADRAVAAHASHERPGMPLLMRASPQAPAGYAGPPPVPATMPMIGASPAAASTASAEASAARQAPLAVDVDRLVEKVLRAMTGRLRVERERRGGHG